MVLLQNWQFFHLFFFCNIGQENVFYDILERKNAFLGYKTRSSKSRKIDIFPKGFVHGFGPKLAIFASFFLGKISQENVFYNILERKNAFLGYKTRSSKSRKIDIFPKGLFYGFGPKLAIFPPFFFRQYWPGKCVLWYSRTKKRLSRL